MTLVNTLTLCLIGPLLLAFSLSAVSDDIAVRGEQHAAKGSAVRLWKHPDTCHETDWLCWLKHEPKSKG